MLNFRFYASGSSGNCYLVYNEDTNLLVECGISKEKIKSNLLKDGLIITDCNACFISHSHEDHSLAVDYVSNYINVYSTFDNHNKHHKIIAIEEKKPFKVGSIIVLPLKVNHGATECYSYVFVDKNSSGFFGTDFYLMQQDVSNFKFRFVAIECNYDEKILERCLENELDEKRSKYLRQLSTHMGKNNCIEHLKHMNLTQCEEIILLHASIFLISKEQIIKEFESVFNIKTIFANK